MHGVKTGISLNYYYRERETCMLCAMKKPLANDVFLSANVNISPKQVSQNSFCCCYQQYTSYKARRISAVSISILQSHQWTVHP